MFHMALIVDYRKLKEIQFLPCYLCDIDVFLFEITLMLHLLLLNGHDCMDLIIIRLSSTIE